MEYGTELSLGQTPIECKASPINTSEDRTSGAESDGEVRQLRKRRINAEPEEEDEVDGNNAPPVVADLRIPLSTEEFVDALVTHNRNKEYSCQHPNCDRVFPSIENYNAHYMSRHMHKCSVCKKQLPGSHFLELHVLETHDTLFELMAERKPMYACVAEECPEKFQSAQDRYNHFHEQHKGHELFATFKHFQNISHQNTGAAHTKKGNKSRPKQKNKLTTTTAQAVVAAMETEGEANKSDQASAEANCMEMEAGDTLEKVSSSAVKKMPKEQSSNPKRNDRKGSNSNKPTHFKFGHHTAPTFRHWHAGQGSSSEGGSSENNCKMDMSSMRQVLETTPPEEQPPVNIGETLECV